MSDRGKGAGNFLFVLFRWSWGRFRCWGEVNGALILILPLSVCRVPTNDLILIVSNKGAEGDVGDAMVVSTDTENVTRFKGFVMGQHRMKGELS